MLRFVSLLVILAACDGVFGPMGSDIKVPIDRPAAPARDRAEQAPDVADAHEVAERVWALLQLGQLADAETQCAGAEALAPAGTARQRAVLLYRCGRVAEARRDAPARTRRLRAATALSPSPRVDRALSDSDRPPLAEHAMAAVRARLAEQGARNPEAFRLVDGPITLGPHRAASFEACAAPSEVCQGALVTFGVDDRPLDALLVAYGIVPGSLEPLTVPGASARIVVLRGDLPAQLQEALYLAARLDAGRITPVAFVHSTQTRPDRAARVRLDGDALVIDERPAPWDARLRLFAGAPVAASPR